MSYKGSTCFFCHKGTPNMDNLRLWNTLLEWRDEKEHESWGWFKIGWFCSTNLVCRAKGILKNLSSVAKANRS